MSRPKVKKPSPELASFMKLLQKLTEEKVLLVRTEDAVLTVHGVRLTHNAENVPSGIVFDT